MEVIPYESGKMIGFEYGSPEASAEFVTWVLNRFPPLDDVTARLSDWGLHPRSPRRRQSRNCFAIGP